MLTINWCMTFFYSDSIRYFRNIPSFLLYCILSTTTSKLKLYIIFFNFMIYSLLFLFFLFFLSYEWPYPSGDDHFSQYQYLSHIMDATN